MSYSKEEKEIIIKILSNSLNRKVMYDKDDVFLSSLYGGFWDKIPEDKIKEAIKQAKKTISEQKKFELKQNDSLENYQNKYGNYGEDEDEDDNDEDDEEKDEDSDERLNSTNNGFLKGLIVGIIIVSLIWGIGKKGKYEGQTAEEWFYDYDDVQATLEDYQNCVQDAIPNIDNYCSTY